VGAVRLTHGCSRDHRPDLQRWVVNPVRADTGGDSPALGREPVGPGGPGASISPLPPWGRWWCWRGRGTAGRTSGPGRRKGALGGWRGRRGRLLSRGFACEADARRALEEASGKLPYHRLVYLGVQEERRRGRGRRPYRLLARLGSWSGRGGAWDASSWPRTSWTGRPCRPEVLGRYKDQTRTVERGFRSLQDPLFFTGSTFLKRPERVMAQRPTLRWVRLVELEGRPRVLNLAPHHESAARLLGAQRCYLLE
jgi:hypothetical protein